MKRPLLALLLCAGCAGASSKVIITPDGQKSVRATCHPDIMECYQKIGEVCQGPYDVVSTSSHMGGTVKDWIPGPVEWFNVVATCR